MFTNPSLTIWENYSSDKWYLEAGNYPILAWEYEQQPRPVISSPNQSLNANYNDLTVLYTVLDTDSPAADCSIYWDSILNETDLSITPASNQSFIFTNVAEGNHNYYISCTDGVNNRVSPTFTFNVDTLSPIITSYSPPANGTMFNYSFLVNGTVTDPNLLSSNYTVFSPNGSILYNTITGSWETVLNASYVSGIYNLIITAIDTFNNTAREDIFFYVNDTTPPYCFGFSDQAVSTVTPYTWASTCLDERLLYSFNMTCNGADNYNFTEIGINNTYYDFTESNTFNLGNTSCSYIACDGHTSKKLERVWYARDNKPNTLEFEQKGKKNKIKTSDGATFKTKKLKDRIKFNISFTDKKATSYIIYYETSENSHYYPAEDYIGWIVDFDALTWVDFNSPDNDFTVMLLLGIVPLGGLK